MEQTWRWFGPRDSATLAHARQAGASGIVTALHDIPYGEVWPLEAIRERQAAIAADPSLGLSWSVVESVPVHEDIKLGRGDLDRLYENFRQTLRNLGACGIRRVCYNFMLILDWTRTDLTVPLPGGGRALRFDAKEFAAFDCFILRRQGAEQDYSPEMMQRAGEWHDGHARPRAETSSRQCDGRPSRSFQALRGRGATGGHRRSGQHDACRLRANLLSSSRTSSRRRRRPASSWRSIPTTRHGTLLAFAGSSRTQKTSLSFSTVFHPPQRPDFVHGLARRQSGERCSRDGSALRRPYPFRPSQERRQGRGRILHGIGPSRRGRRHGRGGADAARRAAAAKERRRPRLPPSLPARSRP